MGGPLFALGQMVRIAKDSGHDHRGALGTVTRVIVYSYRDELAYEVRVDGPGSTAHVTVDESELREVRR
jgi:hypothetical protein